MEGMLTVRCHVLGSCNASCQPTGTRQRRRSTVEPNRARSLVPSLPPAAGVQSKRQSARPLPGAVSGNQRVPARLVDRRLMGRAKSAKMIICCCPTAVSKLPYKMRRPTMNDILERAARAAGRRRVVTRLAHLAIRRARSLAQTILIRWHSGGGGTDPTAAPAEPWSVRLADKPELTHSTPGLPEGHRLRWGVMLRRAEDLLRSWRWTLLRPILLHLAARPPHGVFALMSRSASSAQPF